MCINQGVNIFSLKYYIEYMFSVISIPLVVMETKVSTFVKWQFWKFIEGIRFNFVSVGTKLVWIILRKKVSRVGENFSPTRETFFLKVIYPTATTI